MLHKCANSSCTNLFRRLHEGKLFQVETEYLPEFRKTSWRRNQLARKVERFWLCDACAPQMTIGFEKGRVVTLPLTHERRSAVLPAALTLPVAGRKLAGPIGAH